MNEGNELDTYTGCLERNSKKKNLKQQTALPTSVQKTPSLLESQMS